VNIIQAQIDAIEPYVKEHMKDIALEYIWILENAQDEIDNEGVNL